MNYAAVANLSLPAFTARIHAAWGMVSGTRLGWGVAEKGYVAGFYPDQLRPILDRGWTRFMCHRPLGDDSAATGEVMNEDAGVENRDPKAQDFDDMLRLVDTHDPDVLAIAYFGSAWDPDFGRQMRTGQWAAWIKRKLDSIRTVLNQTNADIAYDHSATLYDGYERAAGGSIKGFPPGAWEPSWKWVDLIRSVKAMQGREVWIESVPHWEAKHHLSCPIICRTFAVAQGVQPEWLRSRPKDDINFPGFDGNEKVAPSQSLTGRILDWNTVLGRHPLATYAAAIGDVLARGPQFEWAGALNYLPETAANVHRAVIDYAASKVPDPNGDTE